MGDSSLPHLVSFSASFTCEVLIKPKRIFHSLQGGAMQFVSQGHAGQGSQGGWKHSTQCQGGKMSSSFLETFLASFRAPGPVG